MSVRNLDKIFNPQRVAVVGASNKQGSVGYSVLRNLIGIGFQGPVYPVNPKYEAVLGIPAYASLSDVPHPPDLAIVCTPANTVAGVVDECGKSGVGGMIVLSAGFKEIGESGLQLERELKQTLARYDGLRVVGPNCLGLIVPRIHLNASFSGVMPADGKIAFISQSGALCTAILDWAVEENVSFSNFVSVGNIMDVTIADLIDYFGDDPQTAAIILYIESIPVAREFLSAARAFTRTKPIVAFKSGRFAESAKAAASHTGALAGEDAVYDAAFERAGIIRAQSIDDIFDSAQLLSRHRRPGGARLAIVTNAGGPGVIATDELIGRKGLLADLSSETLGKLNSYLPPYWSHRNPIDILGDATSERFTKVIADVLTDDGVDAVLVVVTPQAMTNPSDIAKGVADVARNSQKPILAAWMGGLSVREGIRCLNQAGVAVYTNPEHAVRAFMQLVAYGRNLEMLYETPRDMPLTFQFDRERRKEILGRTGLAGPTTLSEAASKSLLDAYEIPVVRTIVAVNSDAAVEAAGTIGYPVVLKIQSPQITHKSDVGGVVLNLAGAEDVRRAFRSMTDRALQKLPHATIEGVTVQKMIQKTHSVELILGAKRDATFGTVVMVGSGGTLAELMRDRALGLPPLNERLAMRMLTSLRSWPILTGYRGQPAVNVNRLVEVMIRFSYLIADCPEISEFDINPLVASPEEIVALDARAIVEAQAAGPDASPYSHLSIRPYPEHYSRTVQTKKGQTILLRPIRPEDEPAWHALLAACSPETIRSRFRYLFSKTTHAMAARFCFIDYDREMAIVAEVKDGDETKLAGVGRLVADADHDTAEFAVLVADRWQGQGIGSLLSEYCLEMARSWGIKKVVAETDWQNHRMLATFRKLGFSVARQTEGVVEVGKLIPA
jgi:acetyltransferase